MVELCGVVEIARCWMYKGWKKTRRWIVHLIPVRGEIYNSTISSTDRLCGVDTSDSNHV